MQWTFSILLFLAYFGPSLTTVVAELSSASHNPVMAVADTPARSTVALAGVMTPEAESALRRATQDMAQDFGAVPSMYRVSLVTDNAFDLIVRSRVGDGSGAVTGLTVIDAGPERRVYIRESATDLATTMKHEVFHVLWCTVADCNDMPPWLMEGTAIAYSEGLDREAHPDGPRDNPPPGWDAPGHGFDGASHTGDPHAVGRKAMADLARSAGPERVRAFLVSVIRQRTPYRTAWQDAFGFALEDISRHLGDGEPPR